MITTTSNYYCNYCNRATNHIDTLRNGLIICGICKSDVIGQKGGVYRNGPDHHFCTRCRVSYSGNRCISCALRMPIAELFYGQWQIIHDPLTELT